MASTLFTVEFIGPETMATHPHNVAYHVRVPIPKFDDVYSDIKARVVEACESEEDTEISTPVRNLLCFTTDHTPKDPRVGFIFGSHEGKCDVLLDLDNSRGISRKHFAIKFTRRGIMLRNLSERGTMFRQNETFVRLRTPAHMLYLADDRNYVRVSDLNLSISKDLVTSPDVCEYESFLQRIGLATPNTERRSTSRRLSMSYLRPEQQTSWEERWGKGGNDPRRLLGPESTQNIDQ